MKKTNIGFSKDKKRIAEYQRAYRAKQHSDPAKLEELKSIWRTNSKAYYAKNKDKILVRNRAYNKFKLQTDILYQIKANARKLTRKVVLRIQSGNVKPYNIIGDNFNLLFKEHIENQFTEGMSWSNYGEWQVDHIIPLSSVKTEKELLKLTHYTNCQPLWAKANLEKANH